MDRLRTFIRSFYTELLLRTRLGNYCLPRWRYNFTVPQLIFLCNCVDKTKEVPGSIVEAGCALGSTTVFLNKYMDAEEMEKDFFCIDTFTGFLEKDIEYEAYERGKSPEFYKTSIFQLNKKQWFDETMKLNDITRVQSIQADVSEFDFSVLGLISLCLLDVDLYIPTKKSLPHLFEALHPNGILIVDDCNPNCEQWDGAWHAYQEFMDEINQPVRIVLDKLGIIQGSEKTRKISNNELGLI
jgi:O-methyltransferase